jgi:hypothetical protein
MRIPGWVRRSRRGRRSRALSRLDPTKVVVIAVVLAVVSITYWRIWYGVDLTDESFYVVLPYRFALGARPFVDETTVVQQAGLLVSPFVRLYHALAGVNGLVLFVRHLHFLFSLLVGVAAFVSLRGVLRSTAAALLLAVCAVAFVPFDIHSLSYNTLGSGLFTAGCLLGYLSLEPGSTRPWLVIAGVCHGLAVFAYPSLVVAVAACFGVRLALAPERWRREIFGSVLPALAVGGSVMGAVVAVAGVHRVVAGYRRSSDYLGHSGGAGTFVDILHHEWTTLHFRYVLFAALVLLGVVWTSRRRVAALLLVPLPLLVLPGSLSHSFDSPKYTATLEYVAHYGALALPLFVLVRGRLEARRLFAAVWLPALVAGFTTAYTSTNGGVNFGVGFFPAVFVTTAFLLWSLEDARARHPRPRPVVWPAVLVPALLVVLGGQVYRDGAFSDLSVTVESGAYAGLRTSPSKKLFLEQLERDLTRVAPQCRIVFFNKFPAGYLLTKAHADTNSAWIATVAVRKTRAYQQTLLDYWRRHGLPDVAVAVTRIPYARPPGKVQHYRADMPLVRLVHSNAYRLILSHASYVMYERRTSTCGVAAVAVTSTSRTHPSP